MHAVETMAYANQVPWHGLGNKVDSTVSPEEMLVAAGLDWTVEKRKLKAFVPSEEKGGKGRHIDVPNRFALIRSSDERVMTICGKGWNPVQNSTVIDFFRKYAAAGGATLETAGSLHNGKVIWGLANLQKAFSVGRKGDDMVNGYLLFRTNHEVGTSTEISATGVRVVCANTLRLAQGSHTVHYRQDHRNEFDLSAAQAAVDGAIEALGEYEKRAKQLKKLKLGMEDAIRKVYVPALFPAMEEDGDFMKAPLEVASQPKKLKEILSAYHDERAGASNDNGWGHMNAFTYWKDHMAGNNTEGSRLYRAWFGERFQQANKVEKVLLELAA